MNIEDTCEFCHYATIVTEYEDMVCGCKYPLQPYALSNYPGEYRLPEVHPKNGGEQYYRREDVEAFLDTQQHKYAQTQPK